MLALGLQPPALSHAKPVLLIDDRERQVVERHIVLKQCVGADRHRHFAKRQLALTYGLTTAAGFGMGSVVFLSSMAELAHGVEPRHAGFVLLPLVLCSMLGSVGAGRLLNRLGPRTLLLAGFGALALGYAASAWPAAGLWFFLLASMPVGLGVGIVVGGALRSIAIDEAPPA